MLLVIASVERLDLEILFVRKGAPGCTERSTRKDALGLSSAASCSRAGWGPRTQDQALFGQDRSTGDWAQKCMQSGASRSTSQSHSFQHWDTFLCHVNEIVVKLMELLNTLAHDLQDTHMIRVIFGRFMFRPMFCRCLLSRAFTLIHCCFIDRSILYLISEIRICQNYASPLFRDGLSSCSPFVGARASWVAFLSVLS